MLERCSIPNFSEYKSEKKLLQGWVDLMEEHNPDYITGYNIFGFDFAFMYERAEELNIKEEFSKLGRIRYNKENEETKKYEIH